MVFGFKKDASATQSFKAIADSLPSIGRHANTLAKERAVVIGGGTGAPVSIKACLNLGLETSCVVAMADDGGSTGILRDQTNATPPGDIRKCLVAFAKDPEDPLTQIFRYRLNTGDKHSLGNLVLTALEKATGSFPSAIAKCEEILNAQGHVYPSTLDELVLFAQTCDGQTIEGQANACKSKTALARVWLKEGLNVSAYEPATEALLNANYICLGPGSLFTSIIPNLLVPGIVDAICKSHAKVIFVCSVADMQGETWGLSAREHVEYLESYGLLGRIDYCLIHSSRALKPQTAMDESFQRAVDSSLEQVEEIGGPAMNTAGNVSALQSLQASLPNIDKEGFREVDVSYSDVLALKEKGIFVICDDLVNKEYPYWHDVYALRDALSKVVSLCHSPQK